MVLWPRATSGEVTAAFALFTVKTCPPLVHLAPITVIPVSQTQIMGYNNLKAFCARLESLRV